MPKLTQMDTKLNVKAKMLKFLDENRRNIKNIGICNNLLGVTPKIQKTYVDKFEFIIIKNSFLAKKSINKVKILSMLLENGCK